MENLDQTSPPLVLTRYREFYIIAKEAFHSMKTLLDDAVEIRIIDGEISTIKSWDKGKSYRQAMICTVFGVTFLEAYTHLKIVKTFGENSAISLDRKTLKDKFDKLGITDEEIINLSERVRDVRNMISHEKAYIRHRELVDGKKYDSPYFSTAQDEAEKTIFLVDFVIEYFRDKDKLDNFMKEMSSY